MENMNMELESEEKSDVLLVKDEEGTHLIPIANITMISEKIGKYDYLNKCYYHKYAKPRYVVKVIDGGFFYVTKSVYQKLATSYNISMDSDREIGDY